MGIDPSFKHLASSIKDGKDIYINLVSYELGDYMGFDKIFNATRSLWKMFKEYLDSIGFGKSIIVDKVISEVPPPMGEFSAGLFALDTYILSKLFDTYDCIKEIYIVAPSYLSTVHGVKKYKKSDSTKLAKYFLNEVFDERYNVIIPDNVSKTGRKQKGTINNDKAESFLFLLRLMCRENEDNSALIIRSTMSGLGFEAEKLLIKRD